MLPPWPKGPFPPQYTARAVAARLAGGWDDEARRGGLERLRALGLRPHPEHRDPTVLVLVGTETLDAVRAALADAPLTVFRWRAGAHDDRFATPDAPASFGLCPSADPIDALVAVGVASPQHGIGTAALVRFVTTLRGMAPGASIDALAEDGFELALAPKSDEAALRIAARARELCAPLAARCDDAALARALTETRVLVLSWG